MELILALERMLWTVPLPLVLMGSHLYFTLHLRGIQRHTLRGIRLSLGSGRKGNGGVSAWGALATSLAAAIGTGNIIGVATAVALGGPGAVFWCWLTGVFGMATRYGETLVCLNHRAKKSDGSETGGAMYVMRNVLGWRKMGALFAVMGIAAAVGAGALIQSNAIAQTLGEEGVPLLLTGILVTVIAAAVILGGVGSIAKVCEGLVPAMSILYLLGCAAVLVQCRTQVIPALVLILKSAVTPRAAGGGFVGSTIVTAARYGMARGLFTNESGMGTAPMAAAAGPGEHPQEESLISMTGVFWDTVVICAMTGIMLVAAMLKFPERFREAGVGALWRKNGADDFPRHLCVFHCGRLVLLWRMLHGISAGPGMGAALSDCVSGQHVSGGVCGAGAGVEHRRHSGGADGGAQCDDAVCPAKGNHGPDPQRKAPNFTGNWLLFHKESV